MATDETKIGVVITSKQSALSWPIEWKGGFNNITRDNISLQQIHFLMDDFVTDKVISQFDYLFDTDTDYSTWLTSTDIVATHLKVVSISNDKKGNTRTASCSCIEIDMLHNAMTLTVSIKSFAGITEQKQLAKSINIQVSTAFYGEYMQQMNSSTSVLDVISDILKEQDSEGNL